MDSFFSSEGDDADKTENFDSMVVDAEVEASVEPEATEDAEEIDNEENESREDSPIVSKSKERKSSKPKNGKRKRSSSLDSLNEFEETKIHKPLTDTNRSINVGEDFQAVVPDDIDPNYESDKEDPDEQLWDTPEGIDEEKLDEFVKEASSRYRSPIDRALFILTRKEFDFDAALEEISKRNDHRDIWTEEEERTFHNAYVIVGKHFVCIHQMLPHRSLQSIVQYYYDFKKQITYQNFASSNLNESSSSDESEDSVVYSQSLFEGICDNCGENAEKLQTIQLNDKMNRAECKACLIYFEKMNVPRPTSLRIVLEERIKNSVQCPQSMMSYMKEYEKLTQKATGSTYKRRKIGDDQTLRDIIEVNNVPLASEVKEEEEEEEYQLNDIEDGMYLEDEELMDEELDDEEYCEDEELSESGNVNRELTEENGACSPTLTEINGNVTENVSHEREHIVQTGFENGISNESAHSPQPEVSMEIDEAPGDSEHPTSQLILNSEEPSTSESPKPINKTTPEIWQTGLTVCKEEIEVLVDDSRRKLFEASVSASRVDLKEVAKWREEMQGVHHRMERMQVDVDLIPSLLLSNERVCYHQDWSEFDKGEALRCFNWYGRSFGYIADVLGNKTRKQVKEFYEENQEVIDKLIAEHQESEGSPERNGILME